MLIVSSLEGAQSAYNAHQPAHVISVLAGEETVPKFEGLSTGRHLELCVDRESCAETINAAARLRAGELVAFVNAWDGEGDILIHCNRGISRSTAAAYIIMCMRNPNADEAHLAAILRKAAPHADPCPLLVSYADEILGRDARMIEAIEDLSPPAPAISGPVLTLPLAA